MKLPFDLSLKFLFRSILPGFILTLGLVPVVQEISGSLGLQVPIMSVLIACVLVLGWLFVVLDMQIYMLFEGRRFWPRWLRGWGEALERRRLERLLKLKEAAKDKDRGRYLETSVELRRFPMSEAHDYTVRYPSRLGNLLAAYEEYPYRIYGMDSVFYWYRLWWCLDKDLRSEIDEQQALADSTLYSSMALFLSGILALFYFLIRTAGINLLSYLPGPGLLLALGLFSLLGGYVLYRSSLHLHAQFGEMFKSVFDVFSSKLTVDGVIDQIAERTRDESIKTLPPKEKFKIAWRYLHNYRIKTKAGKIVKPSDFSG